MEGLKVKYGTRLYGRPATTSVEEWIGFLTEGSRYDKTIRTKEEAHALDKPVVLYPDLTDIHKFYAFRKDNDTVISLEFKDNSLSELYSALGAESSEQIILLSELKEALGLPTQGGGRRRRSRRRSRKANKAHTPQ